MIPVYWGPYSFGCPGYHIGGIAKEFAKDCVNVSS